MNTERNKFLTEAMGECWHEWYVSREFLDEFGHGTTQNCSKCWKRKSIRTENVKFSTWEGFGKLWEWSQKQEWWKEFCFSPKGDGYHCYQVPKGLDKFAIGCAYIHPDRFADAVYHFLKGSK